MTSFSFSCQCHVKNEGSSTISSIFEPFLPEIRTLLTFLSGFFDNLTMKQEINIQPTCLRGLQPSNKD